jgi:hypothetical protein
MFDPDRLQETYVPGGFRPPGVETRATRGRAHGATMAASLDFGNAEILDLFSRPREDRRSQSKRGDGARCRAEVRTYALRRQAEEGRCTTINGHVDRD